MNLLFDEEVKAYLSDPVPACDKKTALKLLRTFEKNSWDFGEKFWNRSIKEYLPAVSEGTMFLREEQFHHQEALTVARQRADNLSYRDVAAAFLYGVSHGVPAYRTALPAYLYIKNIPGHQDEFLVNQENVKIAPSCSFCCFDAASSETKMSFLWANSRQYYRLFLGGYLGEQSLENSSFMLEEFNKMPTVSATKDDFQVFIKSLKIAEMLPPEKKITAYLKELKLQKILPIKSDELPKYLDILGYMNVLHTDRHFGTSVKYISPEEMEDPVESKNDYGYPVRHWKAKYGVDWNRVHELFDGIF